MSKTKQKSIEELLEEALVPEEEQPYKVPENWVWVRLGNYLENHNGARVPVSAKDREKMKGNIPYYGASGVIDYVNDWTHNGKFVLIAEDGANLISRSKPVSFLAEGKIWVNNHAHILKGKCGTPEEYVCYYINSISLHNYVTGTAQPKLTQKNLNKIPIPVAPLDEQKRIAEKVERLFAKIDEAKQLIEEVKESFELRRAAILDKAFKGQLGTNDPNEKSMLETSNDIKEKDLIPKEEQPYEVPKNWVWVRLEAAKKDEQGFGDGDWILSKHIDSNGSVRLIQLSDIGVGEFLNKSNKYITDKTFEELECTEILPGDILISRMADPIARSCIVPELNQKLITAVDIAFLRVNEKVYNKKFLNYLFNTNSFKRRAERLARGTTRLRITRKNLANLPIPMPPLNEQNRIVEKLVNLLSKLKTEKEFVLEIEEKLNSLKQSILNKAFCGELGTNDPNDEHAIELLKEVLKT
jgi:type I restriction enzyme, S subunit